MFKEPINTIEIHAFADGTKDAVSAVLYAVVHQTSRTSQGLLSAKSRLSKKSTPIGVGSCSHGFEIDGKCKTSFMETSYHQMYWSDSQHSCFALDQGRKETIQVVCQQQSCNEPRKEIYFLAICAYQRKLS